MVENWKECIVLRQANGQRLFGIIHRPPTEESSPAVLICHGLGGNKVGRHRLYLQLADMLAQEGITCLRLDFRGAGDSDCSFNDMTIESQVSDALLGLEYLFDCSRVDAQRVGICGSSLGGAIAVMAAQRSNRVASLALWAPFFNADPWRVRWQQLCEAIPPDKRNLQDELCFEGQVGHWQLFEQLFKLRLEDTLASLRAIPLLHVHGSLDLVIPFSQADLWRLHRCAASAETAMIALPKTDHNFANLAERNTMLSLTQQWFVRTLAER